MFKVAGDSKTETSADHLNDGLLFLFFQCLLMMRSMLRLYFYGVSSSCNRILKLVGHVLRDAV